MKNKITRLLISLVIGIILVLLWLKFININQMIDYLKNINIFWVGISAIFYLLAYLSRSIRWKIILAPVEKISIKEAFNLFMAGMLVNYIIPIRAGELAKGFFLKGLKQTPISKSLPTIFIDKMMDLFPVVIILLLLPFVPIKLSPFLIWGLVIISLIFIIFIVIIILAVYRTHSVSKFLKLWFFWLPQKYKEKVNRFIKLFVEGLSVIKENKNQAILILVMTILAITLDALYIMAMFKAFSYTIPFFIALVGYTLINLSYILPTPPAQIGTNEAIYIIVFTFAFGINKNLVSAAMGFAHLITGSLIFLFGLISLHWLNLNLSKALSMDFNKK